MTSDGLSRQTFATHLHLPAGWDDPVDKFDYQTKGTIGIAVEVIVTFGCKEAPKVEKVKITGFNQIGFIVSSEYEVEGFVDGATPRRCEKSGCRNAIQYDVEITFYVYLIIGVGFGFGGGTGTLGYKSKSFQQSTKFTTKCICCDPPEIGGAP